MRRSAHFLRRLDPARADLALTALMTVELELEIWLSGQPSFIASHRPLQAVAAVLYAAPLAVRRRWPAGALMYLGAVAVGQALLGGYLIDALVGTTVPPAILGYTVGSRLELRSGVAFSLAGAGLLGTADLISDVIAPPPQHAAFATDLVVVSLLVLGPWLAGRLASERQRRTAAFRELAAQASAEREQRAQAAVVQERMRIGRELQDIIIHSVSVMVVQAGGARRLLHSEPGRARASILVVEQTGREALADLRRLLGTLRKDEDPRALTPQPGLRQLPGLLARLRADGLACELVTLGEPPQLTPGTDLVSYRVLEAALGLLAARGARKASVTLRYGPARLELELLSPTPVPGADAELNGILERIALYDGRLELRHDDGFFLRARLPLTAPVAA